MKLKTTLSMLLALSASTAFSGTMGPVCSKQNVETPCEATAWDFGARALYLQPGYTDTQLAGERTFTATNGATETIRKPEDYGWGFFVEGSYHFNHGNDFNLNWYHLDNTYRASSTFAAGGSFSGTTNPQWDAANFEFGQQLHVGDDSGMRVHGGVQYARVYISRSFSSVVNAASPFNLPLGLTLGQQTRSYNGFGPRIGVDLVHAFPNTWVDGFDVYANGAIALLAGSSKSSAQNTRRPGLYSSKTDLVVPEMDIKLGINYKHAVYHGDLTLDAGWMWVDYFSLLRQGNSTTMEDVSFQGLFFGLKWMGNFA